MRKREREGGREGWRERERQAHRHTHTHVIYKFSNLNVYVEITSDFPQRISTYFQGIEPQIQSFDGAWYQRSMKSGLSPDFIDRY